MIYQELRETLLAAQDPFQDILGQDAAKSQIRSALLSGRHIIIVGPPGIGKTTMAKNIAKILPEKSAKECGTGEGSGMLAGMDRFVRVQGSPDLTAEDLIGDIDPIKALKFGPSSPEAFSPGKIFKAHAGILFFDEINRAPERLQNALLQVLEEGEVTIGSYQTPVPTDFLLIGTMNPQDSSTEKLSTVFLDRFDVVHMTYPKDVFEEEHIVTLRGKKLATFPPELLQRTLTFVRTLRISPKVEKAPSVRASIGLYERAQANALLDGRQSVIMDDVKDAIMSVLAHRIELKPSAKYALSPEQFLQDELRELSDDSDTAAGGDG